MILSGTPERSRLTARAWRKAWGPLRPCRGDSGGSQTSARYAVEDRTVFERTMRCLDAQEHLSMRAWGTRLLQVSKHGFARLAQQGKLRVRARLRVAHAKNIPPPVDILQAQSDDLCGPQAVARQQRQYGVIAQTDRAWILASHFQHSLHFFRT